LGYDIIHNFGKFNGTSRSVLAEVKRQPFVYPYENGEWRFIDFAREYFISRLEQQNGTILQLHGFLKEYFEKKLNESELEDSPQKRELEWRVNYHLVPSAPEEAINNLNEICENAARANRVADIKGVIDLFKEQDRWLSSYNVEENYFEGRYAYIKNDFKNAERCFNFVWNYGKSNRIKAIAGHLLGVIWARNNDVLSLNSSEKILRESLKLEQKLGDRHGEAMVLNSLGGVLVKLGGRERLEEAETHYRDSLKLVHKLGDRHGEAMVLNSLGGVLVKLGGPERLEEAETHYRDGLKLEQKLGARHGEAMVLNSLGGVLVKLGGRERLEEAETHYWESLKLHQQLGDRLGEAMVLNSLGGVLVKLGGRERLEEAETHYRESLKIGQDLNNLHHQAQVMNSLGGVLVRLGGRERLVEAKSYYRESLKIGQDLNNLRHQAQVMNSLGGVLVRLGGRERLVEAESYYRESLRLHQQLGGDRRGEAMNLNGLLKISEMRGELQTACELLKEMIKINNDLGNFQFVNREVKKLEELQLRIRDAN
jgi:tetratricopeptide (TPR) repeat protein